jgi:hypothetical protein
MSMDEPKASTLPPSLVNGRLEGINVADLMWNLCRRRSTGVLQLGSRGMTKKVYIDGGRIVFAASSDPNDRLGEMLLRDGIVTLDQLERAIAQLTSGKRLGAILVEAGHLSPENLVRGVLSQVKGIVLGLFAWEEGDYAFHEGPLPTEEVVTLSMRTAEILLQGIRQIRSFTRIRRSVGPPSARFRLEPGWQGTLDGLDIRDGERMLLQRLDASSGSGTSIDAMCREVFLSNYEIYQALWAFRILGIVHEVDQASDASAVAALSGRLERRGLPDLLIQLSRDSETGVLHLTRGSLERTMHIKDGMCVFATSNAIDDGLVAHLLRRGVISLRDREETARRLLSNKRVGTILLEMGVIDESDLRATVREQLSEIIFDSFRWEQGDYNFVAGELPTIEEITLNRGVEDLIFAGVRRVTSWSRVREGCGGLGARLVLQPEYLSVLDKMCVGPEEWELISLLKAPKSVVEICRESVLGDFRSCQILWALRLLGAIGEAPLEQSVDAVLTTLDVKPAPVPQTMPEAAPEPAMAMADEPEPAETAPRKPTPDSIPVSEADESAEIVSEPWRLAAERPPEPPVIQVPLAAMEAPAEAERGALHQNDVEAAFVPEPAFEPVAAMDPAPMEPGSEDALPHFELGEPGTGLEDMKVDMRPADAGHEFELGPPASGLEPDPAFVVMKTADPAIEPPAAPLIEPAAELLPEAPQPATPFEAVPEPREDRTTRISPEELEAALRGADAPMPAAAPQPAMTETPEMPAMPERLATPVPLPRSRAGANAAGGDGDPRVECPRRAGRRDRRVQRAPHHSVPGAADRSGRGRGQLRPQLSRHARSIVRGRVRGGRASRRRLLGSGRLEEGRRRAPARERRRRFPRSARPRGRAAPPSPRGPARFRDRRPARRDLLDRAPAGVRLVLVRVFRVVDGSRGQLGRLRRRLVLVFRQPAARLRPERPARDARPRAGCGGN